MTWRPLAARTTDRPQPGDVIAYAHGVWRVTGITPLDLDDHDRDAWLNAGMPNLANWWRHPFRLGLAYVGGVRPDGGTEHDQYTADVRTQHRITWCVYPGGRWPRCSCCGEPMPCRAELQDQEIEHGMAIVEKHAAKQPGCCWSCGEPITTRQRSITYPGDNLDLPGGIEVAFHRRGECGYWAEKYELRWIAADPRNERILTWPKCGGILIVHADGSSECASGLTPVGADAEGEHDCQGHLSHDHGTRTACYVDGDWFAINGRTSCPRGCTSANHPGIRTTPRPPRKAAA